MIKKFNKIFHEPLLHFLILGLVLYVYNTNSLKTDSEKIISIKKAINESEEMMAYKIYTEVLLQEAYNLGLEKQDEVITQRLIRQMEFILVEQNIKEPSEEVLYEYYIKNIAEYSVVDKVSFYYFEFDSIDSKLFKEKQKMIDAVKVTEFKDAKYLKDQDRESLEKKFGRYFTRNILKQNSKVWSKAIPSKNLIYLVHIDKKIVLDPLDFEMVEDRVYKDYQALQLQKLKIDAYAKLSKKYKIIFE
jgi:hypothetical protein